MTVVGDLEDAKSSEEGEEGGWCGADQLPDGRRWCMMLTLCTGSVPRPVGREKIAKPWTTSSHTPSAPANLVNLALCTHILSGIHEVFNIRSLHIINIHLHIYRHPCIMAKHTKNNN